MNLDYSMKFFVIYKSLNFLLIIFYERNFKGILILKIRKKSEFRINFIFKYYELISFFNLELIVRASY